MSHAHQLTNATTRGLLAGRYLNDNSSFVARSGHEVSNAAYRVEAHRRLDPFLVRDHRLGLLCFSQVGVVHGAGTELGSGYEVFGLCTSGFSPFDLVPLFDSKQIFGHPDSTVDGELVFAKLSIANSETAAQKLNEALGQIASELSEAEILAANVAIAEASNLVGSLEYSQQPWFGVSDEGAVMVQWRNADCGLMLVFCGDGLVTVSEKRSGGYYLSEPHDFVVSQAPAAQICEAIKRVLS